jgi:hypothetical protein
MCEVKEIAGELVVWVREATLLLSIGTCYFVYIYHYSEFMNNFDTRKYKGFLFNLSILCNHFL